MQEKALGGPIDALADNQEDVEMPQDSRGNATTLHVAKPGNMDP